MIKYVVCTFLFGVLVSGCTVREVRLYPISGQDIQRVYKNEQFTPDRDGYFLSDFYMQEVLEAKVL